MGSKKELEAMGYNQPPADSRTNDSDDDGATVSSESAAPFQSYRPYSTLSMAPNDESPPAYAEINISNDAFSGAANITDDGRINVNINRASNFFAHFMSPAPNANPQHDPSDQPPAYIPEGLGFTSHNLPPPRLNIVIQIVGSRGDVQPFVALGKVLKNTFNHRVRIATHGTFQNFVEENGLEFFCIGGNPAELMAFMVKNPGLIPKRDTLRSGEISRRRKGIQEMVEGCWRSCFEPGDGTGEALRPHKKGESLEGGFELSGQPFVADVIIANPPSFAHIHIAEKLGIPLHMMFTMPWSPTRAFPHPLVNMQASGSMDNATANTVTYGLVEMFTWQGLADIINKFRVDVLELEALTVAWTPGILHRLQIPFTYCWSPALIPKPQDWSDHIDVSGFFMLDLASNYSPDQDLDAFLKAGPPPVYIGFGSIVVNDPDALTKLIFEAVRMAGVRALVSKGWGGLGGESLQVPDNVFMLGNCPHDWLFKHVSAVVHHGGAGTSSAGIHAGVPTAIVPFFGDQPFWGSMIARAGAGPPPIPFAKLTALKLAEALIVCGRPDVRLKAKELGAKICQENGTMQGAQSFHKQLDIGDLRCSLLPHRTAVWKVKRSKVKLCAMAAALLVRNGLLSWSDLKIYRSQEHNTVAEPWEPVSGFTANVINDIANVAYALADFHSGVDSGKMVSKTKEVGREAGKGVAKLIELGAMTPINMSIGMAKGFRNAPKLYNDPMVRESEKVKGIASGFKVAGKEFGYGIYDGVTGLVMQPYIGAQTGGKKGMVKGIAKGLGGFLLKPMGAFWALPAYGFQGAYMQLKGMGKKTYQAYIEASRVAQGEEDLRGISPADEKDILEGWKSVETGEGKKKSFWAASASSLTRPMTSGSSAPSYSSQPRTEEPPMPPMPRFPSERQPSRASTYDRFDDQRLGVHGSEPPASIAEDVSDAASVHSSRYMQHQSTGQSYQSYTYSDRGSSYSAAGPAGSVVSRSSTWRSEQPQFPSQAQAQPIPQQQNHIPQEPQELESPTNLSAYQTSRAQEGQREREGEENTQPR
ncbi:Sterol 3-beta-glucosyltransferase [Ceratocystis platani]|uniref:Sterol 3-beta-glucosyltransferase n=1 Tax=Ceratocystis fimbriata f. sp. platani TaxID=88771 RepID=A0A0F8B2U8_CERFI|nr:Sterol 3-beta-glucosyltransferase [Ceratocystis platani]